MALAIDHRDAFRVFQKESGSAYARYKSRYDEIWMLEQAEGAE